MQCVSVFAALALALGAGQTMACENAGCAIGDRIRINRVQQRRLASAQRVG